MKKPLKLLAIIVAVVVGLAILVPSGLFISDIILGVNNIYDSSDDEWKMRKVHNAPEMFNFLANGLTGFDTTGDGKDNWYLTQYEMLGNIYIMIKPPNSSIKEVAEWESMYVGSVPNAESSTFADLNNDGIPEVIVSHGVEYNNSLSGVTVFQYVNEEWVDLGDFAESESKGHIHFVRAYDMNNNGYVDIICGGRGNTMAGTKDDNYVDIEYAGLFILMNPGDDTVDLSAFTKVTIDDELESGHGFVVGDINLNGYLDITVCNSDFNTRPEDKAVIVYLNEGDSYSKQVIYKDPTLYTKEQVAISDINNNGKMNVVLHKEFEIVIFEYSDGEWDVTNVAKPKHTQHRARMIYLADLNNDGLIDIIGGLIHKNGILPRSKSSVFWMENKGDGTWETHTIKFSEGFIGLMEFNGEKWDLCLVADLDGDGDLDIIANCEEYNRLHNIISVVWFENPFKD